MNNTETLKSFVRHAITAIGAILTALGFMEYAEVINQFSGELDSIFAAGEVLIGLVIKYYGFFKDKVRFDSRGIIVNDATNA